MVLPQGISLLDWAASLQTDYPSDNVPILLDETAWREWAAMVISLPSFSTPDAPDPYTFSDWREWADRLIALLT